MKTQSIGLLVALLFVAGPLALAQAPKTLSHQGSLEEGGVPVNGTRTLGFGLYTSASGGTAIWAEGHPNISVTDGVFAVVLGSTTPLPSQAFFQPLWLEMAVGSTILSPRTAMTATPYSMGLVLPIAAQAADSGALLSISNTQVGGGQVNPTAIQGETAHDTGWGVFGWATAAAGSATGVRGQSASPGGSGVFGFATALSGIAKGIWGISASTDGRGVDGQATASSGATYGVFGQSQSTGGRGIYGFATASSGATYGVYGESASTSGRGVNAFASAATGSTFGVFGQVQSTSGIGVRGYAAATSGTTYGVYGESASTSGRGVNAFASAASGTTYGVFGQAQSTSGTGVYALAAAGSGTTFGVYAQSNSPNGTGVSGRAAATTGLAVGVLGESNASIGIGVKGVANAVPAGQTPVVGVRGEAGATSGPAYGVFGLSGSASGYGLYATNTATNGYAGYFADQVRVNDALYVHDGSASSATIILDANFNGDGRVITEELEITGGSDLAEHFDVAVFPGFETPLPGMVVSIDTEIPGRLAISATPYDGLVAGIISGAGDVETGLLMGQRGSIADGDFPVALVGRVYVLVDADYGPVHPGDLLTTSGTPGHAMLAADRERSQGAVIGKAMTGLESGQGLVLVLVSLQ